MLELWGTHCPSASKPEEHMDIDRSYRDVALYWLRANNSAVFAPKPTETANAAGEKWWVLVLATGAVREAGYVIVLSVPAVNAAEIKPKIALLEGAMGRLEK